MKDDFEDFFQMFLEEQIKVCDLWFLLLRFQISG